MTAAPNVIDGVEVEPMGFVRNPNARPEGWSEADEMQYAFLLAAATPLGCECQVRDYGETWRINVYAPRWHSWKRDPETGVIEAGFPKSESLGPWIAALLQVIDEGLVATPRR